MHSETHDLFFHVLDLTLLKLLALINSSINLSFFAFIFGVLICVL